MVENETLNNNYDSLVLYGTFIAVAETRAKPTKRTLLNKSILLIG